MKRLTSQRGDTIVEVLICLAVLGFIVAGAYSIVNASLRNSRQAQERSEATKLAESHVESLKALQNGIEGLDPADVPSDAAFCFGDVSAPGLHRASTMPPADYATDEFLDEHYPAPCKGRNALYNIFVVKTDGVFTVNVRWDRLGGGKEQLQMIYKGYEL